MTLPININSTNHAGLTPDDHEGYHDSLHNRFNQGRVIEESGNFTVGNHGIVNVDTSGGASVVTLPDNATDSGHVFVIRRDGASTVTINRAGSDTFDDGDTQKTLDSDGAAIALFSIGDAEWKIMGTEGSVGGS